MTSEAQRESERRRHPQLIETMSQGVVHHDASGAVVAMNPAAERLLGRTGEQLRIGGMQAEHPLIREDGSAFLEQEWPLTIARRTGKPVRNVVMGVFHPGEKAYRWINVDALPLMHPGGDDRPYEVYIVFTDLTERKRMEEALREREERIATIHAAVTDVLFLLAVEDDGGFRFTSINEAFLRTTGLPVEAVLGRRVEEVVPEPSLSFVRARYVEAITTRKPVRWQETTSYPIGELVGDVAVTPLVDPDGRVRRLVGAVHDITERKRAEEALREANEQLRDADRRKNEFLGMLSHELRNPLAPISNSLYVLEHAAPGGDQARRAQAVLRRQTDQLTRLVDDLLDVTRIARNKIELQLQRLELGELLQRTIEDYRSQLERAGVSITIAAPKAPTFVDADSNRLAQVIGNLLQNAAKFTPSGGRVHISLAADAGRAVLRVVDSGLGLDRGVAEQLFEPFVQADTTLDRSKGGLGLGLALVKGLVELHGGQVAATSPGPGKGSTFTVRLPLDGGAPNVTRPEPVHPTKARIHVLVIEDNRDAAETLREVLELNGHEVAVAYDGAEGIAKARASHPDLVICDIGLPGMDGYAVARTLRADAELSRMHLVALSGYALPNDLRRATEAGFEAHLAKPPSIEALEAMLSRVAAPS